MTKLRLYLTTEEFQALVELAGIELRSASDQARHIVREELKRRAVLSVDMDGDFTGYAVANTAIEVQP